MSVHKGGFEQVSCLIISQVTQSDANKQGKNKLLVFLDEEPLFRVQLCEIAALKGQSYKNQCGL